MPADDSYRVIVTGNNPSCPYTFFLFFLEVKLEIRVLEKVKLGEKDRK